MQNNWDPAADCIATQRHIIQSRRLKIPMWSFLVVFSRRVLTGLVLLNGLQWYGKGFRMGVECIHFRSSGNWGMGQGPAG